MSTEMHVSIFKSLQFCHPPQVNDGFLIEGNELTRGTMLGCWPSSIPELLSITSVEGNCALALMALLLGSFSN